MNRLLLPSAALLTFLVGSMATGSDLESGLEVGASPGYYVVKDCTGPSKGKILCYR
ncbi:MAG: hypothetical protein ACC628_19470 [Pirellulaceae bacterium]